MSMFFLYVCTHFSYRGLCVDFVDVLLPNLIRCQNSFVKYVLLIKFKTTKILLSLLYNYILGDAIK